MPADLFAQGYLSSWASTRRRPRPKNAAKQRAVERAGTRPMATARSRSTHGSTKPPANRSSPRGDDAPTACGTRRRPQLPRRRTHPCPTPGRCLGRVDLQRAGGPQAPGPHRLEPRRALSHLARPFTPDSVLMQLGPSADVIGHLFDGAGHTFGRTSEAARHRSPVACLDRRHPRLQPLRRHHRPLPSPPPPRMARRWRHRPPQPRTPLPHLPRSRPSRQPRRPPATPKKTALPGRLTTRTAPTRHLR